LSWFIAHREYWIAAEDLGRNHHWSNRNGCRLQLIFRECDVYGKALLSLREIAMQAAVVELSRLGPLPSSNEANPKIVERWQELVTAVKTPVSDEEAEMLVQLFGPDDCFGLAWTLLHLVETAPNWPLLDCLAKRGNEWTELLKTRSQNPR